VTDGQNTRPVGLGEAGLLTTGVTRVPLRLAVTSIDVPAYKLSNPLSTILEGL
jgi:hypothetical protein